MSYILDALKKSEKERRRASIPDPLVVQEPLSPEQKPRAVRPYLFMAALTIGILIFGLWFGLWYAKRTPGTGGETGQTVREPAAQNSTQIVSVIQDGQQNAQNPGGTDAGKPHQDTRTSEKQDKEQERRIQEKKRTYPDKQGTSPDNPIVEPKTENEIPPPDRTKLYTLSELPSSLRQKLPDFSFSVFLYTDDPVSRSVRVNGIMMKEGQYVTDGLKLEEILPDGVIFSYLNYRFRVGIP